MGEKDEKANDATLQGEEGSTENCPRECCPGQGLGEHKKGAIDAQIQDLFHIVMVPRIRVFLLSKMA